MCTQSNPGGVMRLVLRDPEFLHFAPALFSCSLEILWILNTPNNNNNNNNFIYFRNFLCVESRRDCLLSISPYYLGRAFHLLTRPGWPFACRVCFGLNVRVEYLRHTQQPASLFGNGRFHISCGPCLDMWTVPERPWPWPVLVWKRGKTVWSSVVPHILDKSKPCFRDIQGRFN